MSSLAFVMAVFIYTGGPTGDLGPRACAALQVAVMDVKGDEFLDTAEAMGYDRDDAAAFWENRDVCSCGGEE